MSGGDINNKKYISSEVSQKGGAQTEGLIFFFYYYYLWYCRLVTTQCCPLLRDSDQSNEGWARVVMRLSKKIAEARYFKEKTKTKKKLQK